MSRLKATLCLAVGLALIAGFSADRCARAAPPDSNYRLVFADEFNGTSVDTRKWNVASPSWTMPNSASTASSSMVSVGNGVLTLSAARNGTSGSFTSGSISSYQKYTFTGGYTEARILLPNTVGSWPAFWGLYTGWPPEADIMEYPLTTGSGGLNNDQYNTAFHYSTGSGDASGAGVVNPSSAGDLRGSYHTFGMDWTAGSSVRFYFDGTQVQSFSNSAVGQMTYMYMILDYAVGGWPGTPSLSQWPAGWTDQMKVDYVRVYQFSSGDPGATWTGASGSSWDTAGNWSTGSVPKFSNQVVTFNGAGSSSVSIGSWRVIGGMTFTGATGYTIGSSSTSLQLASTSGSPLVQAQSTSTANQTINSKLELWSNSIIRNSMTGGQTLSLNGDISGSGTLTADGVGTVVLSGNNSYTGDTTVSSGTLVMTTPTALGKGDLTLASGGMLIVRTDGSDTATPLHMGSSNVGTISSDVKTGNLGINHTFGTLAIGSNSTLNVTAGANATGGSPSITLGNVSMSSGVGAGSTTFNPTTANLSIGAVSSTTNFAKTLVLGGTSNNNAVTGSISNGINVVSLTKSGSSTWTLNGNNTFTGPTSITGGKLVLNNVSLANTASVTVSSGATLSAKGNVTTGGTLTSSGTVDLADGALNTHTVTGGLTLTNSTLNVDLGSASADRIGASGAATVTGTNTVNFSPVFGQSMVGGNSYTILTASGGLSAANFAAGTKPASLGFYSFGFSTPTPSALLVNVTGNPTPAVAYWTGSASTALNDSANNWGAGPNISTSNWSTDAAGSSDALQLPGSTTNVVFNAANATGNAGILTTQLDSGYAVKGLTIDVPASTGINSMMLNTNGNTLAVGSDGVVLASTSNSSATLSGSGSIVVNGPQSWANNSNTRSLNISTSITAPSTATTLTFNGSGTGGVNITAVMADGGGVLSTFFNQAGTTTLSAPNSYTGTTTVAGGIVEISSSGRIISNSTITNGGTLRLSGGADAIGDANTVEVQPGGTFDIRAVTPGSAKTETIAALNGSGGTVARSNSGLTTLTVGSTDASGSFAGSIQNGSGQLALVKIGAGTQTLAGPSTYTGGTTINDGGGALLITHSGALGSGNVTIGNGNSNQSGVLQLSGGIAVTSVPTINFESRNTSDDGGDADIENVSGNNSLSANFNINNTGGSAVNILSTSGTLTLTGNMSSTGLSSPRGYDFYGAGDGLVSGFITNGTAQPTFVQKDGSGTWTLSGNNSFTGGLTVNAGTLILSGNNNFVGGAVTVNDGVAILSGSNSYTGGTAIDAGTVVMSHPFGLGSASSAVTLSGNGTLVVDTDGGDRAYNLNVGSNNIVNLVSGVKTGSVGINHTLGTLSIGVNDTVNVTADSDVNNAAAAGITLGNVTLSSGVGAGSTIFNPTTAKITLGAVTTSTNSAKTLVLDGTNSGNAVTGAISNGSNVVSVTKSNSSTWTLSATSTYTGTTTIGTNNGGGILRATANNALGTGTIQFDGSGGSPGPTSRLELSGGISLANPTINLQQRNNASAAIVNVSGNNSLSGAISVGSGGSFAVVQSDAGQLTLSGGISAASSTRTITLQGAANGVASGVISNGAGTLAVTKDGTGTWTVSNSGNTYTGATTVSGGKLVVNGKTGTGLTTVNSGATLGGNGTIAGGLSASGTVAPGTSPGTLSVIGSATFASGSALTIELGGTGPGTGYDHLNVTGLLSLAGDLNVTLINTFVPDVGSSFDLVDWGSLGGTFTNLNLPTIPNRGWDTSRLYIDGSISVTSTVAGDYSNNGFVDAADYVTWRKNDSAQTTYVTWRTNFGQAAASGPSFFGSVPEPSAFVLGAAFCLAAAVIRWGRA